MSSLDFNFHQPLNLQGDDYSTWATLISAPNADDELAQHAPAVEAPAHHPDEHVHQQPPAAPEPPAPAPAPPADDSIGPPAAPPQRILPLRHNRGVPAPFHDERYSTFTELECHTSILPTGDEPASAEEANASAEWKTAVEKELDSLHANGTFTPVPLAQAKADHQTPISTKWTFKRKSDGSAKGRVVARGFTQRPNQHFDERQTAAPVAPIAIFRLLFAIAAAFRLAVASVDYSTAYLNSAIKELLYVLAPVGYLQRFYPRLDPTKYCLRLHKALYGLRQSAFLWFITLSSASTARGAVESRSPFTHLLHPRTTSPPCNKAEYQRIVGQLTYTAYCTRPDISFHASTLGAHAVNPSVDHLAAANRTLRYLLSTPDIGIIYRPSSTPLNSLLFAFSDSDWAADPVTRRSQSGVAVYLCNGLIDWSSKRQSTVATSTQEAEITAAVAATSSVIYYSDFLDSLLLPQGPVSLSIDNTSTIDSSATLAQPHAKHVALRLQFLRDYVSNKTVHITYVPTRQQRADILTKPIAGLKFQQERELIGLT
jgi:hypothetical protein